jgi:hypothetical protein
MPSSIQIPNFEITKLSLFQTRPYARLNADYFHTVYYKKVPEKYFPTNKLFYSIKYHFIYELFI